MKKTIEAEQEGRQGGRRRFQRNTGIVARATCTKRWSPGKTSSTLSWRIEDDPSCAFDLTKALAILGALLFLCSVAHAERPSEKEFLFPKDGGIYVGGATTIPNTGPRTAGKLTCR